MISVQAPACTENKGFPYRRLNGARAPTKVGLLELRRPLNYQKLVKIGAKVVSHGRYIAFQLAEFAVPRILFQKILSLIDDLRQRPTPA